MDLPNELWLLVLQYIKGFERQHVAAMARCSWFFHTELQPQLFHTVTLRSAATFQAFEHLALDALKPQIRSFLACFLPRRAKQVHGTNVVSSRVPVLHLVRNLAITFNWVIGRIESATRMSSRTILAACPNVETFYVDRRCSTDEVVALIQDRPNVTRAFLANDSFAVPPLILHRGNGLQCLTHIWLNNFSYFTVDPEVFPALTHIVAGFDGYRAGSENNIANGVRKVLSSSRLQRLLLLIPTRQADLKPTLLTHALAELRDRRIYTVNDYVSVSWSFKSIGRWIALTDVRGDGTTWTSGTPVWDGFD